LVRRFNQDAEDLESFVKQKSAYYAQEEKIDSLTAAQVQLSTLQATDKEVTARQTTKNNLLALGGEIGQLNYVDVATVNARGQAIEESFANLQSDSADKAQTLQAALKHEEAKEAARVHFASVAANFVRWARDISDTIANTAFGTSLQAVSDYGAVLKADSDKVVGEGTTQLQEVETAADKLKQLGVVSNIHSTISVDDCKEEFAAVKAELGRRDESYARELDRQQAMEAKRKEFAQVAAEFAKWLDDANVALTQVEGNEDERLQTIQDTWQDGVPVSNQFNGVRKVAHESAELGITENPHTQYSAEDLSGRIEAYNQKVRAIIAQIHEEKEMKARQAQQAAEWAAKDAVEAASIKYAEGAQAVNSWLADAQEAISETLENAETIEWVAQQQQAYDVVVGESGVQKATLGQLLQEADALKAQGHADLHPAPDALQGKFDQFERDLTTRKQNLETAAAKQQADEALRNKFVAAANAANKFAEENSKAAQQEEKGGLEDQRASAEKLLTAFKQSGSPLLASVEDAHQQLADARITAAGKTDLTAEGLRAQFKELEGIITAKVSTINAEMARAAGSDVSPEQIAEFKDVFDHFDKNKNGSLNFLEFRGVLQSLGKDPKDEEVKRTMEVLDKDKSGKLKFDEFLTYMVQITKDNDSQDEIIASFADLTNGAPYITEDQMRTVMDKAHVDWLITVLPKSEGAPNAYDYRAWTSRVYA
jgi:calmodulin